MSDHALMLRAIELARPQRTHPNPRVGALVVDANGDIVGEGAHAGPGTPHAEILALAAAGERARSATLYTSLEPCDHQGTNPPCAPAIIAAGVGKVVVGVTDPDPRVQGKGLRALEKAGIRIDVGVAAEEATALDPAYFHHRRLGRPRLRLKSAMTMDGQTAALDGSSQWITGPAAREDAHRLRAEVDAIMVGAGTVLGDNPRLDVRLPGYTGPQPVPVVVAGLRQIPPTAAVMGRGAKIIDGRNHLESGISALAEAGILDILVEGGSTLAGSLWSAGLIDGGILYVGGLCAGGVGVPMFHGEFATLGTAKRIQFTNMTKLGEDLRIDWVPSEV